MLETAAGEAVRADLREHPAVRAWERLRPRPARPRSVETLPSKKSVVCRLVGAGPGGEAVIAKRCPAPTAQVERAVYAEVLPRLPLPAPRYYGLVEEGDAWCWLFLEDAGGVKFSPDRAADRALAARWLGCLHTAAAGLAGAPALPDRGPGYYREQMRAARPALLRALGNPALPTGGREVLREVAGLCDTLEAGWPALAACCAGVPATLVHGDFRRKNVLVRADPGGPALFPFDWETAGWGLPAADLAPSRGLPPQIDLPAYWSAVRGHWPGLGQEGVERLARAGIVFRRLAAVAWECARVASPWPQKAVASLRIYHAEIAQTLRELGLGRSDGNAPRGSGADA